MSEVHAAYLVGDPGDEQPAAHTPNLAEARAWAASAEGQEMVRRALAQARVEIDALEQARRVDWRDLHRPVTELPTRAEDIERRDEQRPCDCGVCRVAFNQRGQVRGLAEHRADDHTTTAIMPQYDDLALCLQRRAAVLARRGIWRDEDFSEEQAVDRLTLDLAARLPGRRA